MFLEEARVRGYYKEKDMQAKTLDYGRKEYFTKFIEKDNMRF